MILPKFTFVICCLLLTGSVAHSQDVVVQPKPLLHRVDGTTIASTALDTTLPRIMQQAGVIGLSIAIINKSQTAYARVFGLKDREAKQRVDEQTVFEAASLTKPVFAYLVMQLVKEEVLALDTPLHQYLEYKDLSHDPRHKLITARMVLSHSSGLPSSRNGGQLAFVYNPGEYFNYSAEGIFYLQLVVEQLLKKKLDVIMQERVFIPLKMHRSSLVWTPAIEQNYATGYDYFEKRVQKWKPDLASVTASLHTTAGDYALFVQEIMEAKLLGKEYRDQMLKPQIPVITGDTTLYWSLGFGVDKTTRKTAYYQWGSNLGVQNFVLFYPEQQVGVVYFTNGEHGLQIKDDLLDFTIGGEYSTDKFLTYTQYNSPVRQLTKLYEQQGITAALQWYEQLRRKNARKISSRDLNELAAHVNSLARYQDVVQILSVNAKYYPQSWKTHLALAEAYVKLKDREGYSRSVINAVRYCPNPELLIAPMQQMGIKWR